MFEEIKEMCNELLKKTYKVVDSIRVMDKIYGGYTHPEEIQLQLMSFFNIDKECSHIILFEWLYLNGMKDILLRWNMPDNIWYRDRYNRHTPQPETSMVDNITPQLLYGDWSRPNSEYPDELTYKSEQHNRFVFGVDPVTIPIMGDYG